MWATRDRFYSSMKWHIADPSSVEEYQEPHSYKKDVIVTKIRVRIQCASTDYDKYFIQDAKIKETIKLSQANICAYCKKRRMKELGLDDYPI